MGCFVLISSLLIITTMSNDSDSSFISLELPGIVFIYGSFDSQSLFFIDE